MDPPNLILLTTPTEEQENAPALASMSDSPDRPAEYSASRRDAAGACCCATEVQFTWPPTTALDIIPRTAGTNLRIATFNVENLFSLPWSQTELTCPSFSRLAMGTSLACLALHTSHG
jgi:hypothetical protein